MGTVRPAKRSALRFLLCRNFCKRRGGLHSAGRNVLPEPACARALIRHGAPERIVFRQLAHLVVIFYCARVAAVGGANIRAKQRRPSCPRTIPMNNSGAVHVRASGSEVGRSFSGSIRKHRGRLYKPGSGIGVACRSVRTTSFLDSRDRRRRMAPERELLHSAMRLGPCRLVEIARVTVVDGKTRANRAQSRQAFAPVAAARMALTSAITWAGKSVETLSDHFPSGLAVEIESSWSLDSCGGDFILTWRLCQHADFVWNLDFTINARTIAPDE